MAPRALGPTMAAPLLVALGLAACALPRAAGEPHAWAENVCNRTVPVRKDIVIEQPVQYEIKVESMCGLLPCTRTRLETRQDQSIKTIVVHQERLACCEGYAETPARQCAPICLDSCNNGKCVAPNVCKCSPEPSESAPGFAGPTCKRFACLSSQRWGAKCERACPVECSQNSYCSADSGRCLCYPGWHGPECALECAPDSDADDCQDNNKLPPIVEPEANLFSAGSLSGRLVEARAQPHRAQPLVLGESIGDGDGDDIRIVAPRGAWAGAASSYLVLALALMSLVLLAAFLVVKRRYERVRNELYYASAAAATVSSRGGRGPGSEYSDRTSQNSSDYYYSGGGSLGPANGAASLDKNLSFAASTRNILTGVVSGVGGGFRSGAPKKESNNNNANTKVLLFKPRIESHLIVSQRQAEQNIYTDAQRAAAVADGGSRLAKRARAQTPERRPAPSAASSQENIYAVPKSPTSSAPHDTSAVDMTGLEDSDSNIYEEIRPRGAGADRPRQ